MSTPAATFELGLAGSSIPHRFTAFVPDGQDSKVAEHIFEWRTDAIALAVDLRELARAAISGQPPENNLHITFGQRLYRTVFDGAVGQLWDTRLKETRMHREPLRLVLRVDPQTARPLLNLPWEYLHNGNDFLGLDWRTPLSRLPWGLPTGSLPPLSEPLRLLVVIAAPIGLSENMVLNNAREEDLILSATSAARRAGKMEIEFTPNGSPEALDAALREIDPHILHFTGHGVFIPARDTGVLLMEQTDGRERAVPNAEFATLLERRARSLRLVFLSACQSAVATRNEGYADLAPRLLAAGIPAVVAMQSSVLNKSAMEFGSTFYKGLVNGETVDAALTKARGLLARESLNRVDFVVPTLFLSNPYCLQVDAAAFRVVTRTQASLDLTGVVTAQNFVGRSAELRELQTNLDTERGRWRAAIVYGLGGMGKTVLAARLAERMAGRLDGVKSLRMTSTTTARDVLDQISAFLLVNQVRFNHAGIKLRIADLNRIKDQPLPLENKVAHMAEILRGLRLLLIFDNCEDILSKGQIVSRANLEHSGEAQVSIDPDLLKLFMLLIESVSGPSRFLFTSRMDFSPLESGRLTDAVGHMPLSEMGFRDAVYLMETLQPLDLLPIATLEKSRLNTAPALLALSMRDVWERLGGHPYTLNLFAEHSRRSTVEAVLRDLHSVRKQLLEFTLLDRAAAQLSEQAGLLLRQAAVFEEPVPVEGLAYLMGSESDAMPDVSDKVQELLSWGLVSRPPGSDEYVFPTSVREWARGQWSGNEWLELLLRAAQYWLTMGFDSGSLEAYMNARHYFFAAGDYVNAGDIATITQNYLISQGQIELVLRLLSESVRTLQGLPQSAARSNLARVYRILGNYGKARYELEAVLKDFEEAGDHQNVAAILRNLGMLHRLQGEFEQARELYQQSLVMSQEAVDNDGIVESLHELGVLHDLQGEYPQARKYYKQSIELCRKAGNTKGVASGLHLLGILYQRQGDYQRAREHYNQSLEISREVEDRAGMASTLHELGILHEALGEYQRAHECCEQALSFFQEMGARNQMSQSLHLLGSLYGVQGKLERARECYEQSLEISKELEDPIKIASTLNNLGLLEKTQGEYERAHEHYEKSLEISRELGDRQNIANNLANLSELYRETGDSEKALECCQESLKIRRELGDRAGLAGSLHSLGILYDSWGDDQQAQQYYQDSLEISRELGNKIGVAGCLHQLGNLYCKQGTYERAREYYEQSLEISRELGYQVGVASSLAQIGQLLVQEENYDDAVHALAKAFITFQELGMPEQQTIGDCLTYLSRKMGDEAFARACHASGLAPEQILLGIETENMTDEEATQLVIDNTATVLTSMHEKKREWIIALAAWQANLEPHRSKSFASFLAVVRQLVEGKDPKHLAQQVPSEFQEVWNNLLHMIE
jgi:tetratricopeptide (TPR) repeat protein